MTEWPSPIRKVKLLTFASRETDRPATESDTGPIWVGPSAHSHSGYPTAAIFQGLSVGDRPMPGAIVGSCRRATAMAAACPAVIGRFPGRLNASVRNCGAVGAVGMLPQPTGFEPGSNVSTHRL